MTRKEIKKLRKENPRFKNEMSCESTKAQKQLHIELDCREMINSCLCYGIDFIDSHYKDKYIKDLGEKRVIELYNEQKVDFDKAVVIHNVGEDGEGNSYNSIQWEDELEIN